MWLSLPQRRAAAGTRCPQPPPLPCLPFLPQALSTKHSGVAKRVLVTESRERVGGNVTTVADDSQGLLWEEGPNSFQPNDSILQAAVRACSAACWLAGRQAGTGQRRCL